MPAQRGFTLAELLVAITVLAILSSLGLVGYSSAMTGAKAAKIAEDFKAISAAWWTWKTATRSKFPFEDVYGNINDSAPCHDEVVLSKTALLKDPEKYMSAVPKDPWGREYSYDNDLDVFSSSNKWGGVNIQLQWCAGEGDKYLEIAPIIDQKIDKGDGPDLGIFRWDNAQPGGYGYLVAEDSL